MNHVIAFDVSMGKSFMVIYNPFKQCVFEGEITHSKQDLERLKERIEHLIDAYVVVPEIVFESTGVYSKPLERFMKENNYSYCLLNPLEAKMQCESLRIYKTDRSDAHQLALTHLLQKEERKFLQTLYLANLNLFLVFTVNLMMS